MADLPPSAFTGAFHRPFAEQVAFFRAKLGKLVPTQFWDDLEKAEHDRAFMVAGAAKADLLADLAAALDKSIAEGASIETFRKDFAAIVEKHGWHGWTGEATAGGRAWRTRMIYTTNAQTSYSAGRLAQLRAGNFKLWVYKHSDGEMHPRPIHESWDGLVLPPDHPFWEQHYPPSGWGCRCYVLGARGDVSARAMGGDPTKQLPEGWDKIDPKTGEPVGIDEGWGYMPGDTVSDVINQTVNDVAEKIQAWPNEVARAYMDTVPKDTADALATAYRDLPSTADDARRYVQRVLSDSTTAHVEPARTLGNLTTGQVERVNALRPGLDVSGYDFSLTPDGVRAVMNVPEAIAPAPADIAEVPAVLNAPDATPAYAGTGTPGGDPLVRITGTARGIRYATLWRVHKADRSLVLEGLTQSSGRTPGAAQ